MIEAIHLFPATTKHRWPGAPANSSSSPLITDPSFARSETSHANLYWSVRDWLDAQLEAGRVDKPGAYLAIVQWTGLDLHAFYFYIESVPSKLRVVR